jgi:hypothetical protein
MAALAQMCNPLQQEPGFLDQEFPPVNHNGIVQVSFQFRLILPKRSNTPSDQL